MKKILIGIFSIILGFLGFGFCDTLLYSGNYTCISSECSDNLIMFSIDSSVPANSNICFEYGFIADSSNYSYNYSYNFPEEDGRNNYEGNGTLTGVVCSDSWSYNIDYGIDFRNLSPSDSSTFINYFNVYLVSGESTGTTYSEITVYYNSGSSTTITCDGTQAIQINGLSTITSTNTFTPYFNIDYIDENNQILTESYSKDILYLVGTTFKKTYTGNNNRILTSQGTPESTFTGYVPVFDVSGTTQPIDTEYNMFNNFADNSLQVLLSNIPGYIQYVFIIGIILLLIGMVKMLKRRK